MKEYVCIDKKDPKTEKLFLRLPSLLYKNDSPQDIKTERALLKGTHPLSLDVNVFPFVVIDRAGNPVCRCLLTYYPNDPVAYVGFFEAFNEAEAVTELFAAVEKKALSDEKKELLGPFNTSIYIGYRFKANYFDRTYTSEPYNKDYYTALWERLGFSVRDRYVSNQVRRVEKEDVDPLLGKLYERFILRGYDFTSPTKKSFKKCMRDVHCAMMRLYTDFSGFKPITEEQFLKLFLPLRRVLNLDMVKLAYKDGELRAFAIAIPNYRYLARGRLTLGKLIRIMRIKRKPDEYVVLYMGADPFAFGLGGALAHSLRNSFYESGCTSIGALIKEGQVTGEMYNSLYTDKFEYVLLSKKING